MRKSEIPQADNRHFGIVILALFCLLASPLSTASTARAAPWDEPDNPARAVLPFSARPNLVAGAGPGQAAPDRPDPSLTALGRGIVEVLSDKPGPGADRLAGLTGLPPVLADIAAYYQGLGRYLDGRPDAARTVLAPLARRARLVFLGRDALYLSILCAARAGDAAATLDLAKAWLAGPDPLLAPQVLLRAAVAANALGDLAKAQDFLRHLSLFSPWTRAAAAGDALARSLRDAAAQAPAETRAALYDPDAPANVLLRAEGLVEKGHAQAGLALLEHFSGDAGQLARADYIRGKALYRLRRTQAAGEAFARAATDDPASSLSPWARYHQARCLWRSLEPADATRMEALLRQVLAGPDHDDRLREAAARHLALLLVEQGRFPEALDAAGRLAGLAVSPDLAAQGASLAALLRFVTGDTAGAESALAAFVARFPEDDWTDGARYWRAKALLALHRPDEAGALWAELAGTRPNTYYGTRAATALAGLGQAAVAAPARASVRCPDTPQPADPGAAAMLAAARDLDAAGLPRLAERLLGFAARRHPRRIDLALAHIRAADALGRRRTVSRTAWRTFGGCLLRGSAAELAPLRPTLYPRRFTEAVRAALGGSTVSPDLVYSLIRQESFFDPRAVSGAGAVGLMQLLPATARHVGKRLGMSVSREDLFDPTPNIRLGTAFFLARLTRFDDSLPAALAAYNAGESRAARWNRALAPLGEELFIELIPYTETRNYIRRILTNAAMYAKLYAEPGN